MKVGKFWISLLIMTIVCYAMTSEIENERMIVQSIAKSMTDVIREFYIDQNIKFDLIVYGFFTDYFDKILIHIMKELSTKTAVNIKFIEDVEEWNHEFDKSAVIFVPTMQYMEYLHERSSKEKNNFHQLKNPTPKQFKFLIYVQSLENFDELKNLLRKENMENSFRINRVDIRFFEFFMVDNKDFIFLSTNEIYSKDACGKFELHPLNTFDIKTEKWQEKLQNYDHFNHFHGCLMTFFVIYDLTFYVDELIEYYRSINDLINSRLKLYNELAKNDYQFKGIIPEIIIIL